MIGLGLRSWILLKCLVFLGCEFVNLDYCCCLGGEFSSVCEQFFMGMNSNSISPLLGYFSYLGSLLQETMTLIL